MVSFGDVDVDTNKITAISPEIIQSQATINIGTIGHVAHGKTTLVKAISGVQTIRFRSECVRDITIKLGYANSKIYKCNSPSHPRPECYRSTGSDGPLTFPCDREGCNGTFVLARHVSFVDCPGHDILMATMLNGAAVMDAAFLLCAANETCPQPQTIEHVAAIEIMKLNEILIVQNKIDLVRQERAKEMHKEIKGFVQGTRAESSPVIPISAQLKYNVDMVLQHIVENITVPTRNLTSSPQMIIIRSFDINKPGCSIEDLKGGVVGGSLTEGILQIGQTVEISPGRVVTNDKGQKMVIPIFSKIVSLYAEQNSLEMAIPGGLIGVGLEIDPSLCIGDNLVGNLLGAVGTLPPIHISLRISFFLLRRLVGVRTEGNKKAARVAHLQTGELLFLNIGSLSTGGKVMTVTEKTSDIRLTSPVSTAVGQRIALSRRIDSHWRLIGWGKIIKGGTVVEPSTYF